MIATTIVDCNSRLRDEKLAEFKSFDKFVDLLVAKERGVGVSVVREDDTHGYGSLLTVTTQTSEGEKIIAGAALFARALPNSSAFPNAK